MMTEYLMKWKEYDSQHNEWYKDDLLQDSLKAILDFEKHNDNSDTVTKIQSQISEHTTASTLRSDCIVMLRDTHCILNSKTEFT